ncbi:MAG: 4Fe-4S binding protein [Clostridiales bacterium]|nr:4Fe-4S binding protein [Clostridiales bacterium]MCF8022038.1 4Fe-4S binding protein [Clostridiales bacterium]
MESKEKEYITSVGEGIYSINTGDWRINEPVLDQEKCKKCGLCFLYCPVFCIEKKDDYYEINYDYCKGCGICARECKSGAIKMVEKGSSSYAKN